MADITEAHRAVVTRVLEGDGTAARAQRRAAFDDGGLAEPLRTLIDKVAKHAYKVTDEDIAAVRASGLSEFFVPGPKAFESGAKFLLARGYR